MRAAHLACCLVGAALTTLGACGDGAAPATSTASGGGGGSTSSSSGLGGTDAGGAATTGGGGSGGGPFGSGTTVSSSLALTTDDAELWVVDPDADSVSVVDTASRATIAEIALGPAPAVDPTTNRYDPKILPRAIALVGDRKAYVAGESANAVFVVDMQARAVIATVPVPAAPVSLAASPDGGAVFVVSHEAGVVTKIDTRTDSVVASVTVTEHPWAIALSGDGSRAFVTHTLLGPGVTVIDAGAMHVVTKTALADQPQGSDKRVPNGVARGLYAVAPSRSNGELWVGHVLLGVDTAQPDLDFESTVFPTISILDSDGAAEATRLLFRPSAVPTAGGAFIDSVSGPRAIAFTPDGALALMALAGSEDVLVFSTSTEVEVGLVRPLPSALLDGIVVDSSGKHAYVDGRNTHDVTVLSIDETNSIAPVVVDGAPIDLLASDPMPAGLRRGQRLFNSANSAAFPVTKDFWVSCSSCHIEGGSDAVTWLFSAGPRDTPSNAGGPINTGFLMHQGLRDEVEQYDETIRVEQGGQYDVTQPSQLADLQALAAYVNYAIPFPQNPNTPAGGVLTASELRGKATFDGACAGCHAGAYLTDSGAANPTLDFTGPILLHDVGTCVIAGAHPDVTAVDRGGNTHTACDFDTPTLRGVFASPPYFHDGSARTLRDALDRLPASAALTDAEKTDLVSYLSTL